MKAVALSVVVRATSNATAGALAAETIVKVMTRVADVVLAESVVGAVAAATIANDL